MIDKLIDWSLIKAQEERKDRKRSGLYNPSSFGKCFRSQYWNRKNEPITNPPDLKSLKKMAQGTWTHRLIQSSLPKENVEVMVKTDYALGFADIVFDAVTDIKSCDEWQYKRYHKIPTDLFFKNNKNYFIQNGWYTWQLKKDKVVIRSNIFGTYEHTDHEVPLGYVLPDIQNEVYVLKEIWKRQELPVGKPRLYGGKECNYCGFTDKCKELK